VKDPGTPASVRLCGWCRVRMASIGGEKGSFRRNTLVLTLGTLAAQALPLALYPVFTRIYDPEEFGVFATLSLFATIAALMASGAYEHAILIAQTRRMAAHIIAYALLRSSIVLVALLGLVLPFGTLLKRIGVDSAVVAWLPTIPLAAAALVVYALYSEWCVRSRYFGELSHARIWQTSAIAVCRLGLGLLWPAANGFVAGDVVGKVSSAGRCGAMLWSRDRAYFHIHTLARLRRAARRYAHVARFSLPDQLINNLAGSIHVLFLGAAFGTAQLGYVSIVLSVLYLPVTVVSSAVKDVFRQSASVEFRGEGSCRSTYRRLLVPIGLLAVTGFGTLLLIAPWMFQFVLGGDWAIAGDYARILTPLFFWNFVSMSLGGVLVIVERADVALLWQVINLALTVAALLVGTRILNTMTGALWCFSLARASSYILYMALSYYFAERRPTHART